MKPTTHAIISAGVGTATAVWLKSPMAGAVCFLSGIFIDLDHHLDFLFEKGRIPWRYKELYDYCTIENKGNLYLLFHAYEWLAILWFCIFYFHLEPAWLGLAIGLTSHIICDEIANPLRPLAYFFIYRLKVGFDRQKLFKKKFQQEYWKKR